MLVNIHHDSRWEHNRLFLAGVVFLSFAIWGSTTTVRITG